MRKLFLLIILFCPAFAFGQSFAGNYRAAFFNFFSEPKTIIAEFKVKADNSLNGRVKIGEQIEIFSGTVEKNGKFEAVSEREGEDFYKLKGRFDKKSKISFIKRTEKGSGLNKSVSENGIEGTFAKVTVTKPKVETPNDPPQPKVELTGLTVTFTPKFQNRFTSVYCQHVSSENQQKIRSILLSATPAPFAIRV
ncbi:MAG: hypothetical protein ACR2L1_05375 [Pyrinomonadaceae bacterium]